MNRYPAWKNLLILAVMLLGTLVALPNVFGDDPAIQVTQASGEPLAELDVDRIGDLLESAGLQINSSYIEGNHLLIRFPDVETQLQAGDLLREKLGNGYVIALTLASRTPGWLRALGLKPMSLGLDLRGGVHFLFEVDVDAAVRQRLDQYANDFSKLLRDERIRRSVSVKGHEVRIRLGDPADMDRAWELIRDADRDIDMQKAGADTIIVRMTEDQIRARRDFAIQQNTVTLRNRVNELGVAEPVVQRQGLDRIVVQLPGVQDPAQAQRVLGATATLEFRLVCDGENALEAERRGRAPLG
ncbi:MAG TPA: protein translocase subunit SecD, partial [Chromatiales bacterium]|nr:protein translocase subunit SecD [Chromatiales bacterium]